MICLLRILARFPRAGRFIPSHISMVFFTSACIIVDVVGVPPGM